MQQRCYWDYWRVLTHPETRLTKANRTPVPAEWLLDATAWPGEVDSQPGDQGTQEFSGFFVLPTNQNQDITLQFDLPAGILQSSNNNSLIYKLRVQKQAGIADLPLVLQIRPPAGTHWANPGDGWQIDHATGFWLWSGQIEFPTEFELIFTPDSTTP
jgi:hypothetical protein